MIKLTCTYVSESKKSALFQAEQDLGPVVNRLGSGFMKINQEVEVGQEIELPDASEVETVDSVTDDGEVFEWLVIK